jgi:uracil-DNA glycosylase
MLLRDSGREFQSFTESHLNVFNPYFVVLTFGRIAVFAYLNEYGVSLIRIKFVGRLEFAC